MLSLFVSGQVELIVLYSITAVLMIITFFVDIREIWETEAVLLVTCWILEAFCTYTIIGLTHHPHNLPQHLLTVLVSLIGPILATIIATIIRIPFGHIGDKKQKEYVANVQALMREKEENERRNIPHYQMIVDGRGVRYRNFVGTIVRMKDGDEVEITKIRFNANRVEYRAYGADGPITTVDGIEGFLKSVTLMNKIVYTDKM